MVHGIQPARRVPGRDVDSAEANAVVFPLSCLDQLVLVAHVESARCKSAKVRSVLKRSGCQKLKHAAGTLAVPAEQSDVTAKEVVSRWVALERLVRDEHLVLQAAVVAAPDC